MISRTAGALACRTRALGTTVVTTGAIALTATTTGYVRESGSFITDGFAPGMEITSVTGSLVAANLQATTAQGRVITAVTATLLTCAGCATEATPFTGTIVVGIPFKRAFENVAFTPAGGFSYVEDEFIPATSGLKGMKNGGLLVETGLYVFKLYGLSGYGRTAIDAAIDAIKTRFAIGTQLTAGSLTLAVGDVDGNTTQRGPYAGQLIPQGDGRTVCVLTVPWYVLSINAIAA
jgi:hypothetical protein